MNNKKSKLDVIVQIFQIVAGLVTIGTLIVIYVQINQVDKSIRGETNGRLYTHELEMFKILLSDSDYTKVVFDGIVIDSTDRRYNNTSTVIALFADLLEHIALQKENLEGDVWIAWRNWIINSIRKSPMVLEHYRKNYSFYSPEIIELTKQIKNQWDLINRNKILVSRDK